MDKDGLLQKFSHSGLFIMTPLSFLLLHSFFSIFLKRSVLVEVLEFCFLKILDLALNFILMEQKIFCVPSDPRN